MTEHTESRRTGIRTAAERVFAVLTGVSLLGSLGAMLSWSQNWVTPMWLIWLRLAAAALGLMLWKRKDAGFRILSVYLGLVVLRLLVPSPEKLFDTKVSQTLFNGIWAVAGCYSLGHILDKKRIERFLKIFLTGWVVWMACYAAVSVYGAWTDRKIWNIGQGAFWGLNIVSGSGSARLMVFFEPNTSGTLLGLAVVAAFLCIAGSGSRWLRVIHIPALVLCWIALSLTDSRAAQTSTAAGIGTAAGILLFGPVYRKTKGRKLPAWSAAAACALLTAGVCLVLSVGTTGVFNRLKAGRGNLLSGAAAEERVTGVSVTPSEITADTGTVVSFTAETDNAGQDLSYQWQYSTDGETWKDITGASAVTPTLELTVKASNYQRCYRCAVATENGTSFSETVRVLAPYTVKVTATGDSRAEGDTVTLTAETAGTEGKISYQWQVSEDGGKTWADLPDEQNRKLTVAVLGEKRYRCAVTADNGFVVSTGKKVSEPAGTSIKNRGYNKADLLNGRTKIWKQVVRFLAEHRRVLLIGRSVAEPMKDTGIVRDEVIPAEHCHNMFLQMVMESGIPGLLLLLAFILCTVASSVRTAAAVELPLLLRLVPAAVCAVWVGELVECIVRMANYEVPNLAMLMLYAGITCALGKRKTGTGEADR